MRFATALAGALAGCIGFFGSAIALLGLFDPVGTQAADDLDPFGTPPSRTYFFLILVVLLAIGVGGVWLLLRAFGKRRHVLPAWRKVSQKLHRCWLGAFVFTSLLVTARAADWVRPGINTNQPVWGLQGGLLWAVPPGGFRGGEPRGLIRLGFPVLPGGKYDLINFIAIEPIVKGRRGFSELERSPSDRRAGLRILAADSSVGDKPGTNLVAGTIRQLTNGVEQLEVPLRVERFANGAHVRLRVRQRSDRPEEIEFSLHAEPDSAPLEFCILTATMGNFARLRQLWLADEVVSSLALYPSYRGSDFAPHTLFPAKRLHRTPAGDIVVAATTDEENPGSARPFAGSKLWFYGGFKVTQYWRKPSDDIGRDLECVVNARYTYWLSTRPIPGGIAFENFELRERFREGQQFVFGITLKTPMDLGFTSRPTGSPASR